MFDEEKVKRDLEKMRVAYKKAMERLNRLREKTEQLQEKLGYQKDN